MKVRKAQPADAPEIAELHRESIQSLGARYYSDEIIDAWSGGIAPQDNKQAQMSLARWPTPVGKRWLYRYVVSKFITKDLIG